MARTRLTNPRPLVELKYNPYQQAFLQARRYRTCAAGCRYGADDLVGAIGAPIIGDRFGWSMLDTLVCPKCQSPSVRPYRRFFLRAGRRGGKTRVGAMSAIEEMIVPYSIGWCCAPSYPELEDYVIPAFFSILPADWFDNPLTEWSEDRLHLRLPNGAECSFRSLDDPNRGAGPGLDWAWIDEGRKIQELAWHLLRPSLTERKGIAFVTSSPDWGEDWCHRNFYRPAEEGRPGYWAVTYQTKDNPIIDPAEVEEARATMPPELFRREFEASIEYPTGTIYGDVLDQCLAGDAAIKEWIDEWAEIHPARQGVVGLDPGTDHPFAGVKIVATPFGLVACGEYEERRLTYLKHAEGLKAMVGPLQLRWGIDRSQAQASIELTQHGIYAAPAENDVDAGIQRVYSWMATKKLRISITRCPKLIARLRQYRWADVPETKRGLVKPVPYKKDDDLPDALRYAVMLWPELPTSFTLDDGHPRRNLMLLSEQYRREIERNMEPEETGDGLVRVTDDFTPQLFDHHPMSDSSIGDFYA